MARHAHERINPPMRAESTTTPAHRLVHLHVRNNQVVRVDPLQLRVALAVLQQPQQKLGGLLRPAADGHLPVVALRLPLDADLEAAEGDDLLLLDDVLEELLRARQLHPLDGRAGLVCVLEVDAQVAALRLDGCEL